MPERLKSLDILMSDFKNAYWNIEYVPVGSLLLVPTTQGQYIRCIDPRYDNNSSPELLGPAVPGGIFGVAYLMEDSPRFSGFTARLENAVNRVMGSGFRPASHGDFTNGEVKGCKMLYALIHGDLKDANMTEEEVRQAIDLYDINHVMLNGRSKPEGFALNPYPDMALIPRRSMYVTNIGYLDKIGLNPRTYSPKLVNIANYVNNGEDKVLILPKAA